MVLLILNQAFPTYNKSAEDDFENTCAQKYEKSTKHWVKSWDRFKNIVAKGEIAEFLRSFFLQRFQNLSAAETIEIVWMWERVKVKKIL